MKSALKFDSKGLAALGAERLAVILFELAETNVAIKRRLKLELASLDGAQTVAAQVGKRLTTIGKSRGYIDWDKIRSFSEDLEAQRHAIVNHILPEDPAKACDLLWQFHALATPVHERCDDSNGTISSIFDRALDDLAHAARAARPEPALLAQKVFASLTSNACGQSDRLIELLAEPLGQEGLRLLKERFEAIEPPRKPRQGERQRIGWSSRGAIYADELALQAHRRIVQSALADIADALGDVDGDILINSGQKTGESCLITFGIKRAAGP